MEKKNTGFIIVIVVLSLIIGGLSGFIVYDKILNEKRTEEKNNTKNDNTIIEEDNLNQDNTPNNIQNHSETTKELFENLNCITIQVIDSSNGNPEYSKDIAVIVEEEKMLNIISKFESRKPYEIGPIGFDNSDKINFIYNDGTKKELLLVNLNEGLIMIDNQIYKLSNISTDLENEILKIYEDNK